MMHGFGILVLYCSNECQIGEFFDSVVVSVHLAPVSFLTCVVTGKTTRTCVSVGIRNKCTIIGDQIAHVDIAVDDTKRRALARPNHKGLLFRPFASKQTRQMA
jgi:hypothetical protein